MHRFDDPGRDDSVIVARRVNFWFGEGDLRKQIDFAATEDLCRNYRRDYFHNYQFTIPDRIPLGPHTLKLTVFDELSGRMVSYTTNFNVQ